MPGLGSVPDGVEATEPFDRTVLWRMVRQIGGYLAELRYVDAALDHVHHPERLLDSDPWRQHPRPAFHDSIPNEARLTLGATFPFPVTITYAYPITQEYLERQLAQLASLAERWAVDHIATLTARIQPITRPDAATYDQIRDQLETAQHRLTLRISEDFGQLKNNLSDWKGDAAEDFANGFYHRVGDVRDNQQWLVERLLAAAAAFQGTVRFSQHALMNVVANVWELLREQLRMRAEAQQVEVTARTFLTVAAGVTSVLATVFSGGLASGITLALIGTGFTMASQALPDDAPTRTVAGSSAEGLCDQFVDEIREIEYFLGEEYDRLHHELGQVMEETAQLSVPFFLKSPALVGDVSGREFHHVTSRYYRDV